MSEERSCLCSPYAADELRQTLEDGKNKQSVGGAQAAHGSRRTDIVRIKLVHAHTNRNGRRAQRPRKQGAQSGELALMDVVHQDRIKLFAAT